MNIRYARATDKNQIVSLWNYCFEDGEDFVKYYFENVYDKKNTIIIEENNEVLSALQLNKYKIDLRNRKYDVSYVVGVSSKPEVRGLGYMKHLMTYTLEELYKSGEIVWQKSRPLIMSASPVAPYIPNGRANAMPAASGTQLSKKKERAKNFLIFPQKNRETRLILFR